MRCQYVLYIYMSFSQLLVQLCENNSFEINLYSSCLHVMGKRCPLKVANINKNIIRPNYG